MSFKHFKHSLAGHSGQLHFCWSCNLTLSGFTMSDQLCWVWIFIWETVIVCFVDTSLLSFHWRRNKWFLCWNVHSPFFTCKTSFSILLMIHNSANSWSFILPQSIKYWKTCVKVFHVNCISLLQMVLQVKALVMKYGYCCCYMLLLRSCIHTPWHSECIQFLHCLGCKTSCPKWFWA